MKKIGIFSILFVLLLMTFSSMAQTVTTDLDTSRTQWLGTMGSTFPVDMHIKALNSGSSDIYVTWRMASITKTDPNWTLDGVCDNNTCKTAADPGLMDGSASFTSAKVTPASSCDFKVSFMGGDLAAFKTYAAVTLDLAIGGGPVKKAVFVAWKGSGATNITTTLLQDNDVSIYPNPAQNYIDVIYNPSSDVKTIALYNLIGKVVSVYKVTDKSSARCEFNTDMPSGIYVVRVADSKGNVIATRKVTRQ